MHRVSQRMNAVRKRHADGERGGALLELAISIPIFVVILALIFDAGLGFSAARDSSSAARSAARVAALAGDERLADYRAIDAVRAEYNNSEDSIQWMTVYLSLPGAEGGDGSVPPACRPGGSGQLNVCNVYSGAQIESMTPADFDDPDCVGDDDANWCPTTRRDDDGDYLGVGVWVNHQPTVGLIVGRNDSDVPEQMGTVELEDRAVFALYFPEGIDP